MTNIDLIFRIFVVAGFLCALLAEIGVPQSRTTKIAAWALWLVAALIWAFVLRAR